MNAAALVLPVGVQEVRRLAQLADELLVLINHSLTAHHMGFTDQAAELADDTRAKAEEFVALCQRVGCNREGSQRPPGLYLVKGGS